MSAAIFIPGQNHLLWPSTMLSSVRVPLLFAILGPFLLAACTRVAPPAPRREPLQGSIRNHFHYDLYRPHPKDTLSSVSREFGIPVGVLAYVNGLHPTDTLDKGKALKVPFWEELFKGKPIKAGLPSLMWPVLGGGITSRYGPRWRRFHAGIDIRAARGEPIFAAHKGKVVFANTNGGYGRVIQLEGKVVTTLYAHLSRYAVRKGQVVAQGDLIGFAGDSGNVTGPHCHFETRMKSDRGKVKPRNPLAFFPRAPTILR
jgi:hypothetical protein